MSKEPRFFGRNTHAFVRVFRLYGAFVLAAGVLSVAGILAGTSGRVAFIDRPLRDEVRIGNPEASIILLTYFDLECPSCRAYERDGEPLLRERYKGAPVAFAYKHLPLTYLHPNAPAKAEILECAARERPALYKPILSALYDMPFIEEGDLVNRVARQFDLSERAVASCVASGATRTIVENGTADAREKGIRVTPSFSVYKDGIERARIQGTRMPQLIRTIDLLLQED